jgi:hypothetical protein
LFFLTLSFFLRFRYVLAQPLLFSSHCHWCSFCVVATIFCLVSMVFPFPLQCASWSLEL